MIVERYFWAKSRKDPEISGLMWEGFRVDFMLGEFFQKNFKYLGTLKEGNVELYNYKDTVLSFSSVGPSHHSLQITGEKKKVDKILSELSDIFFGFEFIEVQKKAEVS